MREPPLVVPEEWSVITIDHFTGSFVLFCVFSPEGFAMVFTARLMKAWDPTFRRGVISHEQRHWVPLSTTAAGIRHQCNAMSLGCRSTFCTGFGVLAVRSKTWDPSFR